MISGAYFFFGVMLMALGGIGEFILGNTFPSVVFLTFSKQKKAFILHTLAVLSHSPPFSCSPGRL